MILSAASESSIFSCKLKFKAIIESLAFSVTASAMAAAFLSEALFYPDAARY